MTPANARKTFDLKKYQAALKDIVPITNALEQHLMDIMNRQDSPAIVPVEKPPPKTALIGPRGVDLDKARTILTTLSTHFQVSTPKVTTSHRLGDVYYRSKELIKLSKVSTRWTLENSLLHEFTHHLVYKTYTKRPPRSHGPEFKALLVKVVRTWYGADTDQYQWHHEYKSLQSLKFRARWTPENPVGLCGISLDKSARIEDTGIVVSAEKPKGGTMITKIERHTAKEIREEVEKALKGVTEKFGLTLAFGAGRFSDITYDVKLEFKVKETASGISGEEAEFKKMAPLFGVFVEDYGKVIEVRGEKHKFVGFAPRRSKFPYVFKRLSDDKNVLFTEDILFRVKMAPRVV